MGDVGDMHETRYKLQSAVILGVGLIFGGCGVFVSFLSQREEMKLSFHKERRDIKYLQLFSTSTLN